MAQVYSSDTEFRNYSISIFKKYGLMLLHRAWSLLFLKRWQLLKMYYYYYFLDNLDIKM